MREFSRAVLSITLMLVIAQTAPSFARGHGGGGGGHKTRGGHITGFRTSQCKTAACTRKHPSGSYVHPITAKKHR